RAPVVNDEDRYEFYRPPACPRYFFRRLMWGSLSSVYLPTQRAMIRERTTWQYPSLVSQSDCQQGPMGCDGLTRRRAVGTTRRR
ncbi:MAG TPA: hypothetical protein VM366_10250, partial [Anaerolineae bacterium]|nr:hypothetical protein [Anaerolineae bacterium]